MNNKITKINRIVIIILLLCSQLSWAQIPNPTILNSFSNIKESTTIEPLLSVVKTEIDVSTVAELVNAINNGVDGQTINIAAGTYTLDFDQQLLPKSNMIIKGAGAENTIIRAIDSWNPGNLGLPINEFDVNSANKSPYLFLIENKNGIIISDLKLTGPKIHGAIFANNCTNLKFKHLLIEDFLWSGIQTFKINTFVVHDCRFIDSGGKVGNKGAAIFHNGTNYGEFYNNFITRTGSKQFVGFKASGGSNQRIHHNTVTINDDFSLEYMHDEHRNIEIDHNMFSKTMSIPKGGGGLVLADGQTSFHIHHNWLKRSYGIELARNSIKVDHNLIDCSIVEDQGNFMSDFNDNTNVAGPIEFHDNLIKNPGRGIFWTNGGNTYSNFRFYNNHIIANKTVTPRKEGLFAFPDKSNFREIKLQNNIIECVGLDRPLFRSTSNYAAIVENNKLLNVSDAMNYNNPISGKVQGPVDQLYFTCGNNNEFLVNGWNGMVNPNTGAVPTIAITYPTTSSMLTQGTEITVTASASSGVATVEFYSGANKIGEATSSPFSISWKNSTYGLHNITAVAINADGSRNISPVVIVNVTPSQNVLPVVSITSPLHGAVLALENIKITANASDDFGSIAKVDFYIGETLIGSSSTAPYTVNWLPVSPGKYTLTAKATDNVGSVTVSLPIDVEIIPVLNGISYEAENFTQSQGTVISSAIPGYLGTGYATMQFAENFLLWNNVQIDKSGIYRLTFRYNSKVTTESDIVVDSKVVTRLIFPNPNEKWQTVTYDLYLAAGRHTINVDYLLENRSFHLDVMIVAPSENQLPQCSIISPVESDNLWIGNNTTIKADATDSDGSIVKVVFYDKYTKLGEDTQAPFEYLWQNLPAGSHELYVVAFDNNGSETKSAIINIFVKWDAQVTIPVLADTYVSGLNKTSNYGTATTLTVAGNVQETNRFQTYLRFDVNSLSGNLGTVLVLPIASAGTITGGVLDFYRMYGAWEESTLTWNNKPALGTLKSSYTILESDKGHDIYFDVSQFVNEAKLGDGIVSFTLAQANNIDRAVRISSKESTNPSKPRLESMQIVNPNGVETINERTLSIYPNPVQNTLRLNIDESFTANAHIDVYNMQGQKCIHTSLSKVVDNLDVSQLSTGMYIIQVTQNNKQIKAKFSKR